MLTIHACCGLLHAGLAGVIAYGDVVHSKLCTLPEQHRLQDLFVVAQ
jgi:hypothetical protein